MDFRFEEFKTAGERILEMRRLAPTEHGRHYSSTEELTAIGIEMHAADSRRQGQSTDEQPRFCIAQSTKSTCNYRGA
jgi:hypothetical protein